MEFLEIIFYCMFSLLILVLGIFVVGRCVCMKFFRYCICNCFGDFNERVIDGELNVICLLCELDKKIFIEFLKICSLFCFFGGLKIEW